MFTLVLLLQTHTHSQVKHPRREGVLIFAADSREDCSRWIRAFQSGSSIEVQSVSTVEQIRITDLDMQKRWVSLDTPSTESVPAFSPSPSVTPTVPLGPDVSVGVCVLVVENTCMQ